MGLHIKPNCRADFDPAEFSVVCGNDHAAWLWGGNSAREVSPPRDFSQHDGQGKCRCPDMVEAFWIVAEKTYFY